MVGDPPCGVERQKVGVSEQQQSTATTLPNIGADQALKAL
jgi:hypothetical protein